jgi:hypothetical protein
MNMREFIPSHDAIQAQSAIDIAAPPEQVAAMYRNVEKWGNTFPDTIERARIVQTGDNWKRIVVSHKLEGRVSNTLIDLSSTEIGLEESKKKFDASFLNQFNAAPGGTTHYVITSYVSLKGIYRLLKPCLKGYARRQSLRQMRRFVLEPLKRAVEQEHA